MFGDDPEAAVRALTTGMGNGARRVTGALFPLFGRFYARRHRFDPKNVAGERAKVSAALDRISAELGPSGYLVGETFSVADLTAAALLAPLVLPPELEYRPPEPHPQCYVDYRDSIAPHPAFRWAAEMYRRHRGASAEVTGAR